MYLDQVIRFTFSATDKSDAIIFAAADDGTNPNIVTINTGIKSVVEDTTPQLGGNLDTIHKTFWLMMHTLSETKMEMNKLSFKQQHQQ